MDNSFLKEWSVKLGTTEKELDQKFEAAKVEMKEHFPKQSDETIFEKAKMKMKVDHKSQFMSNAVPFVGIIFGSEVARDLWANKRKAQVEIYNTAKEEADKLGDQTIVQKILDAQVVRIDEKTGDIIPLCPKLKKDGQPSKMAGKDIQSPEECFVQKVYGIGTPHGKRKAKGFVLELKGKACNKDMSEGHIVNFKALNNTQEGDKFYILTSNNTDFLQTEDEYLTSGIKKLGGVAKMVESFFADYIVTWEEVNGWLEAKRKNPTKEVVPEKYRMGLMILTDALCIYQNFVPDKGRIKFNICQKSDNLDDCTVLCLADKSLDKSIDFAMNSSVITIGRPWLPAPKEGKDVNLIMWMSGMFAFDDWKIPRIYDSQPITKENIEQLPSKKVEEPIKPAFEGVGKPDKSETPTPDPIKAKDEQPEIISVKPEDVQLLKKEEVVAPAIKKEDNDDPWA